MKKLIILLAFAPALYACTKSHNGIANEGPVKNPSPPLDPKRCWQCETMESEPFWDSVWCSTIEIDSICDKNNAEIRWYIDSMYVSRADYKRSVKCY